MRVSRCGLDSEDTTLDVKQGHVESATTKVVNHDIALPLGFASTKTIGNSSGSRLVDDTENVETSNGTSILGGLSLVVVEVCRHGDDGLLDFLAELGFRDLLHLAEDHGGDFLRRERLGLAKVLDLHHWASTLINDLERPRLGILLDDGVVEAPSDQALDVEDGVGRVHGSLVLGRLTDQALLAGEGDERRGGKVTLLVGDCGNPISNEIVGLSPLETY